MVKHRLRAWARGCLKSRSVFARVHAFVTPRAHLCRQSLARPTLSSSESPTTPYNSRFLNSLCVVTRLYVDHNVVSAAGGNSALLCLCDSDDAKPRCDLSISRCMRGKRIFG